MEDMLIIKRGNGNVEIKTGIKDMNDFYWLISTIDMVKDDLIKAYRESCPYRYNKE